MRAFVFPGQGSQKIGMGRDLAETFPAARDVFNEVDDALGEKLSALIFEGSDDDLRLTENTQPALMAVSLAVVRALEAEFDIRLADHGSFVAGHSLGEYAALAPWAPYPLPILRACSAFGAGPCSPQSPWVKAPWPPCLG